MFRELRVSEEQLNFKKALKKYVDINHKYDEQVSVVLQCCSLIYLSVTQEAVFSLVLFLVVINFFLQWI